MKLGIKAGIDEQTASARMNHYEKATHAPDYSLAISLAKILDVPTSYLYEDNDEIAELLVMLYTLQDDDKQIIKHQMQDLLPTDFKRLG